MLPSLKLTDPWGGKQKWRFLEISITKPRVPCECIWRFPSFFTEIFIDFHQPLWYSRRIFGNRTILWGCSPLRNSTRMLGGTLNLHLSLVSWEEELASHTKTENWAVAVTQKLCKNLLYAGHSTTQLFIEITIGRYKKFYEPSSIVECHTDFVSVAQLTCFFIAVVSPL